MPPLEPFEQLGATTVDQNREEDDRADHQWVDVRIGVDHRQAGQARVLNRLGGLFIELGEEEQALAAYEQALGLGQGNRARRG